MSSSKMNQGATDKGRLFNLQAKFFGTKFVPVLIAPHNQYVSKDKVGQHIDFTESM